MKTDDILNSKDIVITAGEIKRKRPREFFQVGEAFVPAGAMMTSCADWTSDRNWREQTVNCKRVVRKNGKALGPWLYSVNNQRYRHD